MECFKCGGDPCTCQRALAVQVQRVPQKYQFFECSTPGCTVMIGYAAGASHGNTVCKWCQAGGNYYAR